MDFTTKSWLILIATIAAAAVVITIVCKSFKYVRALFKRIALMKKLKSLCGKNGWTLDLLDSPYKSVFGATNGPELSMSKDGRRILVKFFTCLRYADTYTLSDIRRFTTESNAGMTLVNMKPFSSGIAAKDPALAIPHFHGVKNGTLREIEIVGGEDGGIQSDEDAELILCVNPISIEMRRVAGSRTEQVFDGDVVDGYTVYSGGALCDLIAGKKTGAGLPAKRTKKSSVLMHTLTLTLCILALCSCGAHGADAGTGSAGTPDTDDREIEETDTEKPDTAQTAPETEKCAPDDEPDQNESPTLTVYYDAVNGEYMKQLVEQFMTENPDVKIVTHDYTSMAADEFAAMLDEKLRSGDGPDVILAENTTGTSATVPNAISLYNAGAFYDLDKLGVNLSGCNEKVMAGGRYNGAQYAAPLDYSLGFVFTTKERMQRFGIPYGDGTSLSDFASAVGGYVNDGGRAFADLTIPATLAMHNGISPASIAGERSAFSVLTSAVDSIYPGIYTGKIADYIYSYEALGDEVDAFVDGKTLFYTGVPETLAGIGRVYDAAIKNGETPVWFTLPTAFGDAPSPTVGHWLAVNAKTTNTDAARAFVESAVGFDSQHKAAVRYGIPVCESLMTYMRVVYTNAGVPNANEEVFLKWREFQQSFVSDYFDDIASMKSAAVCDSGSLDIVNVVFSDVITGAKSVADALKDASSAIAEHIK